MDRPLRGLRVLDYCWVGAGALVTKLLADSGAEVIKIESRRRPDNLRLAPPYRKGAEGLEGSGYFASRNTSKKSFALDMTHPDAPAIAQRLAAASSVVTNNFRPGVMERWGMDHASLMAINPSLIHLSMPMQGDDGPHRGFVGFGSTISALAGLVWLSGRPDRTPVGTGTHYPDHVPNPGHGLVALLAAIDRRQRTGQGCVIELSQFESTVNMVGPAIIASEANGTGPTRQGNRAPDASPHGVFPTAGDDRWCAIVARSDADWVALTEVLGHIEWLTDERFGDLQARKANEDALERLVADATRTWDAEELAAALVARGVAAARVQTPGDLLEDPQLVARGTWFRLDHPYMGPTVVNRAPFTSDHDALGPMSPAPLLGQDTRQIARDVLGMEDDEVEDHVARGVFA